MKLVVVIPIVRTQYVYKALDTLYKYTDNPTVIVVDQSLEGFSDPRVDMVIKMKNQGFSKASNEGIIHALQWKADYVCVCNDDVEFMYKGWFDGIVEEFASDPRILAVNPESPRIAMWGYGLNNGEMVEVVPYKENYTEADIAYLKQGDYNQEEIASRHSFEIPATFPFTKRGVTDAFAGWCPVFKRESFEKVGLFDERFIWGGGEDYSMMARAYSCAWPYDREECNPNFHWRMVSSMKSWVWHWWGKSKDKAAELDPRLFEGLTPWNNLSEIWPPAPTGQHVDPWGHWTEKLPDGTEVKRPFRRKDKVFIRPL